MSVSLTPTPDMAPWRTEVRSRSAYIYGGELRAHRTEGEDLHTGFAVRSGHARALVAALDQILQHPSNRDRFAAPPPGPAATWTIAETDDHWYQLVGPCYVYGAQNAPGWVPASVAMADGAVVGMFELAHWNIQEVRNRLAAMTYQVEHPDLLEDLRSPAANRAGLG